MHFVASVGSYVAFGVLVVVMNSALIKKKNKLKDRTHTGWYRFVVFEFGLCVL